MTAAITAALDAIRAITDASRRTEAERALARVRHLRGVLARRLTRQHLAHTEAARLRASIDTDRYRADLADAERHLESILKV